MSGDRKIKVGSRKSELALIQTHHVISLLKECHPEKEFEVVSMSTLGDQILNIPLPKIGEKSLFTKELETALANGDVDFVVHSLKDLPTSLPNGLAIGAVLTREDPRDALVLQKDMKQFTLETLPKDSVIGTSSLRRTAQLAKKYPHLIVKNIRGNLNTRLKKLDDLNLYQAIILATAGLIRIGWAERISKILTEEELLYAVGQGALAVECRANNEEIIKLLEPLYDLETALRVTAERSFLKTLGGGCSAPVAVKSELQTANSNQYTLALTGAVWSLDGTDEVVDSEETNIIVKKDLRCEKCPYRKGVVDIENIECGACPSEEPSAKRAKILNIPTEVLKKDPHDKTPVKLPVGVDFMGQCPYLTLISKCPADDKVDVDQISGYKKCPFLNEYNSLIGSGSSEESNDLSDDFDKIFCGLVPHHEATHNSMHAARKLGEDLAQRLISKGALDVMSKAQAIIHGETSQSVASSS